MPELQIPPPRYKVGDRLRFKVGGYLVGMVTEIRRAYTQGNQHSYRVRVPMDPEPLWFELRENDVEKV